MKNTFKAAGAAAALLVLSVGTSIAAPVTMNFSGTVQFANGFYFFGLVSPLERSAI